MKNKYIGIIVIVLVIVLGFWYIQSVRQEEPLENPFTIVSTDVIESWQFKSSHNDAGELERGVITEISRLEDLLDEEGSNDYILYVGIAGQYILIGDGENAYEYLGKALALDSENTGLAWHNMGRLMETLGAYDSARIAFDRMIEAQPLPAYYMSKIDFLERHFPEDIEEIEKTKKELNSI